MILVFAYHDHNVVPDTEMRAFMRELPIVIAAALGSSNHDKFDDPQGENDVLVILHEDPDTVPLEITISANELPKRDGNLRRCIENILPRKIEFTVRIIPSSSGFATSEEQVEATTSLTEHVKNIAASDGNGNDDSNVRTQPDP